MAWWGKLIGGAFGFMAGGALGAALGAALGHQFDKGMASVLTEGAVRVGNRERRQTAFFAATFAVMGHVAKADGQVSRVEIDMAESIMRQLRLNPQQRETAINLFRDGKRREFPLDEIVDQLRQECGRRTTLLRMFLEIQIQAALVDGPLDAVERGMLLRITDRLGLSQADFEHILLLIQGAAAYERRPAVHRRPSLDDAYRALGITANASDAEIKKAYRRLMNQHHPDKLVARGLPEEMIKLATVKTQDIRTAYEQVRRARRAH